MNDITIMQQHLLLLRKLLGWNAQKLGEEIGVTRQTVNKIETNKSPLSKTVFLALLAVFEKEIERSCADTKMFQCILDYLIINPDDYRSLDVDSSLQSARLLAASIATGQASRKTVSDAWIESNKNIYQKYYDKLLDKYKRSAIRLNLLNPFGQNISDFKLNEKGGQNMLVAKKVDFLSIVEEYGNSIREHIFTMYTSYVLDPVRHELWAYVDDEGNVSFRENIGYASLRISNEQRCFIYACGGENISHWQLLPRLNVLLGEELEDCMINVSKRENKEFGLITVGDMQRYIEEEHPNWITEWLREYFSDPTGYIENLVEDIYENVVGNLESNE